MDFMEKRRLRPRRPRNLQQYDNILLDLPIPALQTEGYFPFDSLPIDCQLKVFSYLDHLQKGKLFTVCKRWFHLIQHPSLWDHLSIWNFSLKCLMPDNSHEVRDNCCYPCYKKRVENFCQFILWVNPRPKTFEFKLNIVEPGSNYRELIESVIKTINWKDLSMSFWCFKETPLRPYWLPMNDNEDQDIIYRHRLRARHFFHLFDLFTKKASMIRTLAMPFDWSSYGVKCLTRLKNISSLILEKYFVFKTLDQDLLNEVMLGLPNLKRLLLEVWCPSGVGIVLYQISSCSLEYLDISQSRGFYIQRLDLPKLEKFRVLRHPWNGPFVTSERINIPCLYDVLVQGAPNLTKINDHYLEKEWHEFCYPLLNEVLISVCSCRKHKRGWHM